MQSHHKDKHFPLNSLQPRGPRPGQGERPARCSAIRHPHQSRGNKAPCQAFPHVMSFTAHDNPMSYNYFLLPLLLSINHYRKYFSFTANDYFKIIMRIISKTSTFLTLEHPSTFHLEKGHIHATSFLSPKTTLRGGWQGKGPRVPGEEPEARGRSGAGRALAGQCRLRDEGLPPGSPSAPVS